MGFLGLGLKIVKAGFLIDVKGISVVRFGVSIPRNLEIYGLREGGWLSRLEADEALSLHTAHMTATMRKRWPKLRWLGRMLSRWRKYEKMVVGC